MLRKLLNDLSSSDYRSLQFMIVNSRADSSGSYPFSSAEAFANSVQTPGDSVGYGDVDADADPDLMLNYAAGPELTVVKDDAYSRIKHGLGADDNHVLVVDRCGRLAYQIINPWSLIQFPYVKAAILSTYHDKPCGTCKIQIIEETTLHQNIYNDTFEEYTTTEIYRESQDILQQVNVTLNSTLIQDSANSSNSKIFILNEEGSGETDNEFYSLEHLDMELLKSYNIQIPNAIYNLDTTEINLSQQVNLDLITRLSSYQDFSTNSDVDIYDTSSTASSTIIFENDTYTQITTYDIDDQNNNKSQNLDNGTYLDTSSNHLSSSNNQLGGDDMVEEIYSQVDVSSHNEHDYIVVEEETHHKEYSTTERHEPIIESEVLTPATPVTLDIARKQSLAIEGPDMTEEQSHNQVDDIVESNWEIFRGFPRGAPSTRRVHSQKSKDHLVPIRIIFHSPHVHTSGRFIKKHEYVVLKTGQPDFHGHVRDEEDSIFEDTSGTIASLIDNNDDLSAYVDDRGNRYTKLDQHKFKDSLGNVLESFDGPSSYKNNNVSNEEEKQTSFEDYNTGQSKDDIGKHYQRLLPWINHILNHDNDKNG